MTTTTKTLLFEGLLSFHTWGDAGDILFLSSLKEPLADVLQDEISRKQVTARYWITDAPCTKDEANEAFMKQVMGVADVDFGSHYSECTGYLWTDEEAKIGGHDLMDELRSNVGKYLILEIDIHNSKGDRS